MVQASQPLQRPRPLRWHDYLLVFLLTALLRCLTATIRMRGSAAPGFCALPPGEPVIYYFWHNRLGAILSIQHLLDHFRGERRTVAAMVSASRDGGVLARILKSFRIEAVRGSSSRRGPQALREMISSIKRGHDLALTPDGPRGPCYSLQPGVVSLAQLTGKPLVPLGLNLRWKIRLRTWDRFHLPLPFTVCHYRIGEPIYLPRELSEAQRQSRREQLLQTLKALNQD